MPSQFFGLNIASSGLRAAHAALLTTGNNISNANTPGYSRQKVKQEASAALRVYTTYGSAGSGVDTLSIERIRDLFYDQKYRTNATNLGRYSSMDYYNSMIERYFEDDGKTGFSSLFTRMQADLQGVLTNMTEASKTTYLGSVKALTEYFNGTAANLSNIQNTVNDEIKLACEAINAAAQKIVVLNQQINTIEMAGGNANSLRDKRDRLVDEISSYVSVETRETKVVDAADPNRETKATRFEVHISGGQLLLDGNSYRQLLCVARKPEEKVNQSDVDGLYDIKWVGSDYKEGKSYHLGSFDLHNNLIGGKLQGLINMRDGNNNQFFHGKTKNGTNAVGLDANGAVTSNPNNVATYKITIAHLPKYSLDMDKSTLPLEGTIHIGSRDYKYSGWTLNDDNTYTFTIKNEVYGKNEKMSLADHNYFKSAVASNSDVRVGNGIPYQGIPYYQQQLNEWVRIYSREVNKIMTGGFSSNGKEGIMMLTGTKKGDSLSQYSYDELTNSNRKYYHLTASNFKVNSDLMSDPSRLATKSDSSEGAEQSTNAKRLYEIANKDNMFRGAKISEFVSKIQADISLNKNNSGTMLKTLTALEKSIEKQRESVAGVDQDEEALNLVKYNNAYALSSKMIQTLTKIYDRLILETGV